MDTTTTQSSQPTAYLMLGGSAIARDARGEVLETVDFDADGTPDWSGAGICDHRGGGGEQGYKLLVAALVAAEENARLCGFEVFRVPEEVA